MFTKHGKFATLAASITLIVQVLPVCAQSYGNGGPGYGGGNYNATPSYPPGGASYVPAGLVLNASLATSVSTDSARPGDLVEANLTQPVMLGDGQIPAGSVLEGHVVSANSGGFLTKAGRVSIRFDRLRTPNGVQVPVSAHIIGDLGKYKPVGGSDTYAGEGAGTKVGQAALRTAVGAGAGAALGTAIGAIAGHGMGRYSVRPVYGPFGHGFGPVGYAPRYQSGAALGAGRGAWSGAAIGGGVGLADGLLLRKGKNVVVQSGTPVQLQLDAPVTLAHQAQYGNI